MKYVIGNWKMNKANVEDFDVCLSCDSLYVGLALPFTMLHKHTKLHKGAQNVHPAEKGAFTGEVSAGMLKDVGCEFVIIGHSERRQGLKEDKYGERVRRALSEQLTVVFCVGEELEERDAGLTESVIEAQLKDLQPFLDQQKHKVIIAYEPVWAIGTGRAATPAQANQVMQFIRQCAPGVPLLYGGSVTAENARELVKESCIDGFLVGGASLNAASFKGICDACL